jgi:hypothetical protein
MQQHGHGGSVSREEFLVKPGVNIGTQEQTVGDMVLWGPR